MEFWRPRLKGPNVRQQLLTALTELSRLRPEWRLGQTMANLVMTAGHLESDGVWDLDDAEALAAAKMLIKEYSESESKLAESSPPLTLEGIPSSSNSTISQPPQQLG